MFTMFRCRIIQPLIGSAQAKKLTFDDLRLEETKYYRLIKVIGPHNAAKWKRPLHSFDYDVLTAAEKHWICGVAVLRGRQSILASRRRKPGWGHQNTVGQSVSFPG